MPNQNPIIIWFRKDLRLGDNPALHVAAQTGQPVIALYIDETDRERAMGGASKWWLHQSLLKLETKLKELGTHLVIRQGKASEIIYHLIDQTNADHIVWNRRYAKDARDRDAHIKETLTEKGIKAESFKANLLSEPWEVKNGSGGYYKVFTPYWKAVLRGQPPAPALPAPEKLTKFKGALETLSIADLSLLPTRPDWASKMTPYWTPGEDSALDALDEFLDGPINGYSEKRNRPDMRGTSLLSPHLAFGEISPRQIWHITRERTDMGDKFLSEIGWREFSYSLLFHNPDLARENYKDYFNAFEWTGDADNLARWQMGQTGYPLVDAGMRELWATGWQHNRVRMVTASFLIKHLRIDWREGEKWFWDTLLDADPANNAASWQWVAGSGADAAPFFRIFNPFGQGEKFDPKGEYVRKWVPEIADLPDKFIQKPWEAPSAILRLANVTLGETYPKPIVDHKKAREAALAAFKALPR